MYILIKPMSVTSINSTTNVVPRILWSGLDWITYPGQTCLLGAYVYRLSILTDHSTCSNGVWKEVICWSLRISGRSLRDIGLELQLNKDTSIDRALALCQKGKRLTC